MNSNLGKKILALVRGGNYAHPGEEEAIKLTFSNIPKSATRRLLDLGCGLGGTAAYLQEHGWGTPVGIDTDEAAIAFAQKAYPSISFIAGAAEECSRSFTKPFDLIFSFSAFHVFSSHDQVLDEINALGTSKTELLVFDYIADDHHPQAKAYALQQKNSSWNPISLEIFPALMNQKGWESTRQEDFSDHYQRWYQDLLARIESSQAEIIALATEGWYEYLHQKYALLLSLIEDRALGGVVLSAKREA